MMAAKNQRRIRELEPQHRHRQKVIFSELSIYEMLAGTAIRRLSTPSEDRFAAQQSGVVRGVLV